MHRVSRRLGLSLALCFMVTTPLLAALVPADLRCEYQTKPLAIDSPQPRLSWILDSDPEERGQVQTAYQVLVASSTDLLKFGQGDLWDSGRVASDRTTQVVYAGKSPTSRMPCSWKVRVWDKDGNASAWSQPVCWAMGLLKPADWKAQWIGGPQLQGVPERPGYLPAIYLRKQFKLDGVPKRAIAYVTAAGLYALHLNGKRVDDACFTSGWTNYDKRLYYQAYDVTGLLQSGENVVGAILGDGWTACITTAGSLRVGDNSRDSSSST